MFPLADALGGKIAMFRQGDRSGGKIAMFPLADALGGKIAMFRQGDRSGGKIAMFPSADALRGKIAMFRQGDRSGGKIAMFPSADTLVGGEIEMLLCEFRLAWHRRLHFRQSGNGAVPRAGHGLLAGMGWLLE